MLEYAVELTPDDNDTFMVTCPDIEGVATYGETKDEALMYAVDALMEAIAARIAHREDIPEPRRKGRHMVRLPSQTALKVMLYQAARRQKVGKAELARRLSARMDPQLQLAQTAWRHRITETHQQTRPRGGQPVEAA